MTGHTSRSRGRWPDILLMGLVFLALVLPRWAIIAQSATADETKWVARAANFSTALGSGRLQDTYQSEHPGVTTMWAGALGLRLFLPACIQQLGGQLEPFELDQHLLVQGCTPLEALVAGRRVMVLLNALLLTLAFVFAARLLGQPAALLAAAFWAFSPFFVAHTHLLHLDGLQTAAMLLSILAYLSFLETGARGDLLLSGAAAGLSWLTKTPAFVLGPVLLGITLAVPTTKDANFSKVGIFTMAIHRLRPLLLWAAVGIAAFIMLWPAMWIAPLATLQNILSQTLAYAGGHDDPLFFQGAIYSDGRVPAAVWYYYPLSYAWRSTPVVLLGLALVLPALWRRWPPLDHPRGRHTLFALLFYAAVFAAFMTLGGKKFDRYLLPAFPALQLIAAAGWVAAAGWAAAASWVAVGAVRACTRMGEPPLPSLTGTRGYARHGPAVLLITLVAIWQALALASVLPYPLSYYNPLLGGSERAPEVMQIGWGEGLDAAGRYLSAKANSQDLTVASWYRSAFAYYFNGPTISIGAELTPQEEAAIQAADYAVIYAHQWQRDAPSGLLDYFASLEAEHVVEINGLEYARIYDLQP